MKKILLICAVLIGAYLNVSAQEVVRNIGDFTTLKVFDKIPVELIHSSTSKVVVSGLKNKDVMAVNKNGELKIKMKTSKLLGGDDIKVKVYFNKLNSIQASEGAYITGASSINTKTLYLNVKEGAVIEIQANVKKVSVKANSGGEIKIAGTTENQDIVITSGGKYSGKGLKSKQTTVAINAGGNAEITASDVVNAKTRAGGKIDIYGKPPHINKKTFAGGVINVY